MENEQFNADDANHAIADEQPKSAGNITDRVEKQNVEEHSETIAHNNVDEYAKHENSGEEEQVTQIPLELVQAIQLLQSSNVSEQWSGLLPSPLHWNQYSEETQQKMIEWNDARIVDESKRQDRLTDAEIEQAKSGQALSVLTMLLFGVLGFVAFLVTRSPYSWGLLTVPIVAYVTNLLAPVASKSSRDKSNKA